MCVCEVPEVVATDHYQLLATYQYNLHIPSTAKTVWSAPPGR